MSEPAPAALPRGAVTFLFTDVEGSTELVRRLRDGYAKALDEHRQLVRGAVTAHGGHEIDAQGDSCFAAFGAVRDAVLAAVEAQHALDEHPWSEDARFRVRMGIHTGEATPADGRYAGLAVHRGARICAVAHGGQIVVSPATRALLEDGEEGLGDLAA